MKLTSKWLLWFVLVTVYAAVIGGALKLFPFRVVNHALLGIAHAHGAEIDNVFHSGLLILD